MTRKIILASTSPRRKQLLEKTGLVFEICHGDYEEDMTLKMEPKELAKFLSLGKAQSVISKFPDALIIGSDTFIAFEDKVLGKPHTPEKAKEMLQMLRGKQHSILTGYAIIDTKNNKIINDVVETKVFFKNYSDQEIDEYIATGEPLERAGAYALQELGARLIEKIEGDRDSAIGLPVENILQSLKEFE